MNIAIKSAPLFFIALFICPLVVDQYVSSQGYTFCSSYSSVKPGTADIWFKDANYCFDEGYRVRSDLVEWMIKEQQAGNHFSAQQMEQKIVELMALPYYSR